MTADTQAPPKGLVAHRSVSQLNQYEKCPHAYKLARIDRVWQRPAAWLSQGTAFHSTVEHVGQSEVPIALEDAQALFTRNFDRDTSKMLQETPNPFFWFRSGPYAGPVDIERRHGIGREQVEKWYNWVAKHPEEQFWLTPNQADDRCSPFDPDLGSAGLFFGGEKSGVHVVDCGCKPGGPAVEVPFDIDLGGVRVKGFIDAVMRVEVSPGVYELRVRDYKTGNNPGDDFQLGVYSVAIAETFGVERPLVGDYWMGRSGKATVPYDLSEWTKEAVTERFLELEANIQAGKFDPLPEADKCRFCDVSNSCEFAAG